MNSPKRPLDALGEALRRLPDNRRRDVLAAFSVVDVLGTSWRDRYSATEWAMSQLGAIRSPANRRKQSVSWRMACGCTYYLEYAQPRCIWQCSRHPGNPITIGNWLSFLRDLVRYVAFLGVWMGALVALIGVIGFFQGKDLLGAGKWPWLAIAVSCAIVLTFIETEGREKG